VFNFPGLSAETVLFRALYGDDAMFGTIARISSTTVFLFIIFGAFLLRSGAGDFVIELSRAVAGRLAGGPGLVAVMASGLTGTISGSAVANTASTGVITIPLMKRAGFPHLRRRRGGGGLDRRAAHAADHGRRRLRDGELHADPLRDHRGRRRPAGDPLLRHRRLLRAHRGAAAGAGPGGRSRPSLRSGAGGGGASFIIPIGVVVGMLIAGFTPSYAAVFGIGAVIASSWLTASPMGPVAVWEALALGARNMIMTAVLLCSVGIVVNVITTAGVGNTFSLMISDWAGGNVLIAFVLIALASLVLGMGLPVTAPTSCWRRCRRRRWRG
jgi:TRAP-type uncharacterized transport system fused permease subunit